MLTLRLLSLTVSGRSSVTSVSSVLSDISWARRNGFSITLLKS